jgi:cytochrome P450
MDTPNPVATGVHGCADSTAQPFKHEFNLADFESDSLASRLARWAVGYPQVHYLKFLLRPLIGLSIGHRFIACFDDVQEVLREHDVFEVPFGPKVELLNGGPNFLLGMANGKDYQRVHRQVAQAFRREDVPAIVAPLASAFSNAILKARTDGVIDAMQDLITAVPTLICEKYYGVPIADKVGFAQWTMAMSSFLFGDPTDNEVKRRIGIAGGERVSRVVDTAIQNAKASGAEPDSVLDRLVKMQAAEPKDTPQQEKLTDAVIRSFLIGMITGFVPTNTMAAGNMLIMLLRRPDFMARACEAVREGDDDLLKRCLFEAMRFRPLNPGPYRICTRDYAIAAGTSRETRVQAGDKVLAGTQYAMFDSKRVTDPHGFDPERASFNYMLFGYGLHWCIGAYLAEAQITQTFKALLARGPVTADWSQTQYFGMFPAHLNVRFA